MIDWLFSLWDNRELGAERSSGWAEDSRNAIKEANNLCQMGLHKPTLLNPLATHHIKSFHEFPELERESSNWIVLCRFHHFLHAHLKNWSRSNLGIQGDCDALNAKIKGTIYMITPHTIT